MMNEKFDGRNQNFKTEPFITTDLIDFAKHSTSSLGVIDLSRHSLIFGLSATMHVAQIMQINKLLTNIFVHDRKSF